MELLSNLQHVRAVNIKSRALGKQKTNEKKGFMDRRLQRAVINSRRKNIAFQQNKNVERIVDPFKTFFSALCTHEFWKELFLLKETTIQ